MSHLEYLRKEADLRREHETLLEEAKYEIFIVNDLFQKFGRDYLDYLHEENKSFAERHHFKHLYGSYSPITNLKKIGLVHA